MASAPAVPAEAPENDNGGEDDSEPDPGVEAGAPAGPNPDEEAALQAEYIGYAETAPLRPEPEEVEPMPAGGLPDLDELIGRIPAEVRTTIDELFRAKFVKVERVPKKHLKR